MKKTPVNLMLLTLLCTLPLLAHSDNNKIPDYEDGFTFKKGGLYAKDPNIWVYSKAFAQRFGMPDKWVDDKLEGIEAAAWRVEPGQTSCGFGRQEKACKVDPRCVLDLYIDTTKHKLPWAANSKELDYDARYTSLWILRPQGDERRRELTAEHRNWPKSPFADSETGEEAFYISWSKVETDVAGTNFYNYEKESYPGLAMVSLQNYGCYFLPTDGRTEHFELQVRRYKDSRSYKVKSFHNATLPGSFTARVGKRGEEINQQSHEFYKGVWESR